MRNSLSYLKDKFITDYIYKKNGFKVEPKTVKSKSTLKQINESYDEILKKIKNKDFFLFFSLNIKNTSHKKI